jgi:chitin disaccharide deacetylase
MARPDAPLRRIWLCADDYGLSPGVNAAIRDLLARGRINATSAMVVAPSLTQDEADRLLALKADNPAMAIGLHVTLTAPFAPLTRDYALLSDGLFMPLAAKLRTTLTSRLDTARIESEVRAQIDRFGTIFRRAPDFVDGHQHVQVFPQVRHALLDVVARDVPDVWVRQCGRAVPWRARLADRKGLLLDALSAGFRTAAGARKITVNPAFAGSYDFTKRPDFARLFPQFLESLPGGSVVMCHPGFVDDELRRLDPLTDLRAAEHDYFASDAFVEMLKDRRVTLL